MRFVYLLPAVLTAIPGAMYLHDNKRAAFFRVATGRSAGPTRTTSRFWSHGGPNDLPNLLPLCHFHHRQVHEGGWQVIRAGDGFEFVPPERLQMIFARGPDVTWAA